MILSTEGRPPDDSMLISKHILKVILSLAFLFMDRNRQTNLKSFSNLIQFSLVLKHPAIFFNIISLSNNTYGKTENGPVTLEIIANIFSF